MKLLILDADGVFMNEMPYWKAVLATALDLHGLAGPDTPWERLTESCLVRRRLQAVTKQRGCNSNWDFAAVMSRALDDRGVRSAVSALLSHGDTDALAATVEEAMRARWRGVPSVGPPLNGFGIERGGAYFNRVVERFQDIFERGRDVGWGFARHEPAMTPERMRGTFETFRRLGFTLGVCTSRRRDETVGPMTRFGILDFFDRGRILTDDDVRKGERRTGVAALGKPHWFALVAAAYGVEFARDALGSAGSLPRAPKFERFVYVGDAPADFQMAGALRGLGVVLEYGHIDSGVTPDDVLREIGAGEFTLTLASDLAGVAAALEGGGA
jgi:phosphoglycolate phosphatase-like HAD superfamily hydrolase